MKVHVYSEPGMASVNSYVVEGDTEVVVIDAQRGLSSARRLLRVIEGTGKPVAAIFLTHPHPDHFGGLPVLTDAFPEAPLYALAQTRASLENGANGYIEKSKQALGDDFDADIRLPTRTAQSGETLTLAGIRFQIEDAGLGEADCMMMLYAPEEDTLFCADVVQHAMTAFLLEGHLEAWLAQLDRVTVHYGATQTVYPGHGASGPASELFGYQRSYLQNLQRLVSGQKGASGVIAPESKALIVEAMKQAYPGFLPVAMIPNLLELDIDAIVEKRSAA